MEGTAGNRCRLACVSGVGNTWECEYLLIVFRPFLTV